MCKHGIEVVITAVSIIPRICRHTSSFVSQNTWLRWSHVPQIDLAPIQRASRSRSYMFWSRIDGWRSWVVFNFVWVGLRWYISLFECSHVVFALYHSLSSEDWVSWDENQSSWRTYCAFSQLYCLLLFYCVCDLHSSKELLLYMNRKENFSFHLSSHIKQSRLALLLGGYDLFWRVRGLILPYLKHIPHEEHQHQKHSGLVLQPMIHPNIKLELWISLSRSLLQRSGESSIR